MRSATLGLSLLLLVPIVPAFCGCAASPPAHEPESAAAPKTQASKVVVQPLVPAQPPATTGQTPSTPRPQPSYVDPRFVRLTYAQRIEEVRRYYKQGSFTGAVDVARDADRERLEEEGDYLVYRRDELNRLDALASYRLGIEYMDKYVDGKCCALMYAYDSFCNAIQVAPGVVDTARKKFPLSRKARPVFERAKRECFVEGGWRVLKKEYIGITSIAH